MGAGTLTAASTLMCPHGGTITVTTSNTKTVADGAVLRDTDTFTISGCSFNVSGSPVPCLTVRWVKTDARVTVLGGRTLSEASIGLCLNGAQAPQGTVLVQRTQSTLRTV